MARFRYQPFATCNDYFYVYLGKELVGVISRWENGRWRVSDDTVGVTYATRTAAARQALDAKYGPGKVA